MEKTFGKDYRVARAKGLASRGHWAKENRRGLPRIFSMLIARMKAEARKGILREDQFAARLRQVRIFI